MLFGLLTFLIAITISSVAIYYSVAGLVAIFAAAAVPIIIMGTALEVGKLVAAVWLHRYWSRAAWWLKTYLSIAVVVLMIITSMGIYGFLTSAFQDTYNQFNIKEKQISFLQQKEEFWGGDVARYDEELKRISNNISTLSNARSQQIQVRDTSVVGGIRTTISTSELRLAQARINVEEQNRKDIQAKREVAADSLQQIQLKILDLESTEGVSSELGPLQYLSELLDRPMNQIINWLILTIIFVFDPLAVTLVVAFNNALQVDRGIVDKQKVIRKRELYDEKPDDEEEELTELQKTLLMEVEEEEVYRKKIKNIIISI